METHEYAHSLVWCFCGYVRCNLYESDDVKVAGKLRPHGWAFSDLLHFRLRAIGICTKVLT